MPMCVLGKYANKQFKKSGFSCSLMRGRMKIHKLYIFILVEAIIYNIPYKQVTQINIA